MIGSDKKADERYCNCKHSRCVKLYCECLSARVPCGKNCRCVGCQNTTGSDPQQHNKHHIERKMPREQLMRIHKGCACRRSNCWHPLQRHMQVCGLVTQLQHSQNNQSLTNRRVINHLRIHQSEIESPQAGLNLYPLFISQNSDHLRSIVTESNPLGLDESWLQNCASHLYQNGRKDGQGAVVYKFIEILAELEQNLNRQLRYKQQQFSEGLEESPNDHDHHKMEEMHKIQQQNNQKPLPKNNQLANQQNQRLAKDMLNSFKQSQN